MGAVIAVIRFGAIMVFCAYFFVGTRAALFAIVSCLVIAWQLYKDYKAKKVAEKKKEEESRVVTVDRKRSRNASISAAAHQVTKNLDRQDQDNRK